MPVEHACRAPLLCALGLRAVWSTSGELATSNGSERCSGRRVGLHGQEVLMKNPWVSMWLSAANSAAGAARGFWTAEMRGQHQAMLKEARRPLAKKRVASPKKRTTSKRVKRTSH